jgi:hypothetical protein
MIKSRLDNTEVEIILNPSTKYAFMLSGGLDSAVLLYLLMKNNTEFNIQPFAIKKYDGSHKCLSEILNYLECSTSRLIKDPIFVGDPAEHHDRQSKVAINEINNNYPEYEYIIFGTNSNPPESVVLPGLYPRRTRNHNPKIITPFRHLYKTHIVDFVFEYGLHYIMDITHSCTEQEDGRCEKCFQCNERAWAFAELNQIDTGKK